MNTRVSHLSARLFATALPLALTLALASTASHAAPPAQTAPELLAKYNFENIPVFLPDWGAGHGSSYKPATGWKTPFKVSLDSENPHAGANALRFDLLESSEKEKIVHGPAIKIPPAPADRPGERNAVVRLFVRATGIAGKGAGIRVLERDEKNASLRLLGAKNTLVPIMNSADWVAITAEGALHSRTASITFMIVANQSEVPATIWIDDVSVELVPAAAR